MTSITRPDQLNTEDWVGVEKMYPPPDWHGVSPNVVAQRGRAWNQDPNAGPWLDQPDAQERIAKRLDAGEITEQDAELLLEWTRHGYCVLPGAVADHSLLDEYADDLDSLWTATEAKKGLQIMSLHLPDRPSGPVSHEELLSWPKDVRLRLRDTQLWRIHYHHPHTNAGAALTQYPTIVRMVSLLLGEDPVLVNAIGFRRGSQVGLHQDLCAYHIHPTNRLIGVWLACHDVDPNAGPLAVYPGSHRTPIWPGFANYPQTNLRSCHLETRDAQTRYLEEAVVGKELVPVAVKKGDVIFQHPLQIHKGAAIVNPDITRKSMVIHYSVRGGDRMHEVEGPFNW